MWKRKIETLPKTSEEEMRENVEQQLRQKRSKEEDTNDKTAPDEEEANPESKKIDTSQLTLDEIEEIRRKRDKNKPKDVREEKEEGEINDDESKRRPRKTGDRSRDREEGEVGSDDEDRRNRKRRSRSRDHHRRSDRDSKDTR